MKIPKIFALLGQIGSFKRFTFSYHLFHGKLEASLTVNFVRTKQTHLNSTHLTQNSVAVTKLTVTKLFGGIMVTALLYSVSTLWHFVTYVFL